MSNASTVRSLSTLLDTSRTSSYSASWTAAAVATVGLVGGSAAWTFCDEEQKTNFVRSYSKGGIRDPMTTYAKYAMERQMKEDEASSAAKAQEQPDDSSKVQATSAATVDSDLTPSEYRLEEATRNAKKHAGGLKVFSGNGNLALSLEIARHLGINLGKATVGRFADGEVNCVIQENVRGKDVYIVQPTCPPVNDNIMELLLMVSTLRRASARRITVVIPYYGYARQDRKMQVSDCYGGRKR